MSRTVGGAKLCAASTSRSSSVKSFSPSESISRMNASLSLNLKLPAPLPSAKRPSKRIVPAGRTSENCTFDALAAMSDAASPVTSDSGTSNPITLLKPRHSVGRSLRWKIEISSIDGSSSRSEAVQTPVRASLLAAYAVKQTAMAQRMKRVHFMAFSLAIGIMYESVRNVNELLRTLPRRHDHRHSEPLERPLRLPRVAREEAAVLPHAPVEGDGALAIAEAELLRRVVEIAVERLLAGADGVVQQFVDGGGAQRAALVLHHAGDAAVD